MSGSTSEAPLGAFSTLGVPSRLIPPHSVQKPYMNSPPSSIVTMSASRPFYPSFGVAGRREAFAQVASSICTALLGSERVLALFSPSPPDATLASIGENCDDERSTPDLEGFWGLGPPTPRSVGFPIVISHYRSFLARPVRRDIAHGRHASLILQRSIWGIQPLCYASREMYLNSTLLLHWGSIG